jgi:hypothetical protein
VYVRQPVQAGRQFEVGDLVDVICGTGSFAGQVHLRDGPLSELPAPRGVDENDVDENDLVTPVQA